MASGDGSEARRYHERTKHSFESVRASDHYLDWDNRPDPLKRYRGIETLALPGELPRRPVAALDAIAQEPARPADELALPELARVLRWGAGVVRSQRFPGGETYHFRTYASAGALYPVEIYVASAELPGLAAGLYHFDPLELALGRLRGGDVRGALADAAALPAVAEAGAVLVLAGTLWRSAWKYQARAYRHLYWDAGTMLANLLALAASAGAGPKLVTAFVDEDVNHVLGLDGEREASLALLAVGRSERATAAEELEPLALESEPLSASEQSYPEALATHRASSLASVDEVRTYRAAVEELGAAADRVADLPVRSATDRSMLSNDPLETVLRRRGSARDFAPDPIPSSELAVLLARALAPIPSDLPAVSEIYLIANAVEGLQAGAFRFSAPDRFELVRGGDLRAQAGYLTLEQLLGARAAATVFFLADLERVLAALGDRGYRAAQLEAGIRAGRLYLGAYAQGLGATGLTFYDDDVTEVLAPGTAKNPMLCVAIGVDGRRPKLRRLRARE